MSRRNKLLEFILILLLFVIFSIIYFRSNFPFKPGLLLSYSDQLLHVWIFGWNHHALFHDPLNVFNANINYPALNTLALSDHMFGLMPNWLIGYLTSGDYVAAHNYAYLIARIVSGMGAYYYFRHWKFGLSAAVPGAAFFAFFLHPTFIEEIQITSLGYAFFVFLFLEKYLDDDKRSNLFFMSVFYIIGSATGFYFAYMLNMALVIYLIIFFLFNKKLITIKRILHIISALFISNVILFPTVYPYLKLYASNVLFDADKGYLIKESRSLNDANFIERLLVDLICGVFLLARRGAERKRVVYTFIIFGVFFHILSLGPYLKIGERVFDIPLPYYFLSWAPGFKVVRVVWRYTIFAFFGDVFLLTALLNGVKPDWTKINISFRNGVRVVAYAIITIFLFSPFITMAPKKFAAPVPTKDNFPRIYGELNKLSPGPIIEFPLIPSMKRYSYLYQYLSLFHRRDIFNGNSGYTPQNVSAMYKKEMSPDEWAGYLRGIGVKYIVSHQPDFMARIVEDSGKDAFPKPPPLPPSDPGLKKPAIWMDPIENAIFTNVIDVPEIYILQKAFGFNLFQTSRPAAVGKDIFIIDFGNPKRDKTQIKNTNNLPSYVSINGSTLKLAFGDVGKFFEETGAAPIKYLNDLGVNRLEISGYRHFIEQNIHNPFLNISPEEAQKIRINKVAETDGDVIWKIEP